MKPEASGILLMLTCVMYNKLETMNHLKTKIPNFFNKEAELSLRGNSIGMEGFSVLVVALMYSSDDTFDYLVDTVIHSKTTVSSSIQRKWFSSAFNNSFISSESLHGVS